MAKLAGARTVEIPTHRDARGFLSAMETEAEVPFPIRRIYYVYGVAPPFERGGHAHPDTDQLLVCLHGTMRVYLRDALHCATYDLARPSLGLFIPAMIWARLYDFTPETVCLAAASTHYDPPKVIRDWDEYLRRVTHA